MTADKEQHDLNIFSFGYEMKQCFVNYTHTATIQQLVNVWLHWGRTFEIANLYEMNTYKTV